MLQWQEGGRGGGVDAIRNMADSFLFWTWRVSRAAVDERSFWIPLREPSGADLSIMQSSDAPANPYAFSSGPPAAASPVFGPVIVPSSLLRLQWLQHEADRVQEGAGQCGQPQAADPEEGCKDAPPATERRQEDQQVWGSGGRTKCSHRSQSKRCRTGERMLPMRSKHSGPISSAQRPSPPVHATSHAHTHTHTHTHAHTHTHTHTVLLRNHACHRRGAFVSRTAPRDSRYSTMQLRPADSHRFLRLAGALQWSRSMQTLLSLRVKRAESSSTWRTWTRRQALRPFAVLMSSSSSRSSNL